MRKSGRRARPSFQESMVKEEKKAGSQQTRLPPLVGKPYTSVGEG